MTTQTPDYPFSRERPRRLTRVRSAVNPTTTIISGMPDFDVRSPKSFIHAFSRALFATAIFRLWHFILMFTVEATAITYMYQIHGRKGLGIQNTLMNVLGTVLGFVISYRSSASFDRYNEGRRYWSQVVYNIRMFSRVVWFNVPDVPSNAQGTSARTVHEYKARSLVEKKTVLNLLEAFAVSLKHYLRGETGIFYDDLYWLINFLPAYATPPNTTVEYAKPRHHTNAKQRKKGNVTTTEQLTYSAESLPLPVTTKGHSRWPTLKFTPAEDEKVSGSPVSGTNTNPQDPEIQTVYLKPSSNPPAWHVFDIWPFHLCIRSLQKTGERKLGGKRALRDRAQNQLNGAETDNVPLEITVYLSSYIAGLQQRGVDGLTTGTMLGALGQLVDALTGLERILSTPVPWGYQVHLWTVTLVWLFALPFQILNTLGWLTIPGTALAAFVYCGLMKCAEELEDPFGYDYNDLNLDHFTFNIIRQELQALTQVNMLDPAKWAFVPENMAAFDREGKPIYLHNDTLSPPNEGSMRESDDVHTVLNASNVNPTKNTGMRPSGNHSFGGAGGTGLIAGSAIAAAGINAMLDTSSMSNNNSAPPMSN